MRDICTQAELSAGAVYRYFPSKEDLIAGMVAAELEPLMASLRELEPEPCIKAVIHGSFDRPDLERDLRIEISLWAEALTNPRIADLLVTNLEPLTALLSETIAVLQHSGRIGRATPARVLAERTQGNLLGGMLQRAVIPDFDLQAYLDSVEQALLLASSDSTRREAS